VPTNTEQSKAIVGQWVGAFIQAGLLPPRPTAQTHGAGLTLKVEHMLLPPLPPGSHSAGTTSLHRTSAGVVRRRLVSLWQAMSRVWAPGRSNPSVAQADGDHESPGWLATVRVARNESASGVDGAQAIRADPKLDPETREALLRGEPVVFTMARDSRGWTVQQLLPAERRVRMK
jgi:hypothetical protein